jgi:hypothetical protein
MRSRKNITIIVLLFLIAITAQIVIAEMFYWECEEVGPCWGHCWCYGSAVEEFGNCHFQCKDGNKWYCGGVGSCIPEV